MRWLLGLVLLMLALGALCWPQSDEEYSAADYQRDEVIRAEAGRDYRLKIDADHEAHSLDAMADRLAAVRVPRASRHRSTRARSAPKRCARQRSLAEIAADESGGNYTAVNGQGSSASGKYQVLDRTWDGFGGYKRAKDAPPEVQEQWAQQAYQKAGSKPWRASGC